MAKVLLIALDIVGKSMAGPAIRYFEFAKRLSKEHDVVLMTPNVPDIEAENFRFALFSEMKEEIKKADVVVCQQLIVKIAFWLFIYRPRLIIDAYDPQALEHLEIFKNAPLKEREKRNRNIVEQTNFSMGSADGIICANDPQKDLWLGLLMSLKAVTPKIYDVNFTLNHWLAKVPFGLPDTPLKPLTGMRAKFGIKETDTVLLWGGGIWNWFDPLSLIRAVDLLSKSRDDIKLVFMGVKHPNEIFPEMKMAKDAVALVKELGLMDKFVFFNFGWTPYEERQAFLNESDIGVTTHFEHLETRYAFRTRILDYLWAGLPVIATRGDSFAEMIEARGAGVSVPCEDPKSIAEAILAVKANPHNYRLKSHELSQEFTWSHVVKPLSEMIHHLADKKAKGVLFCGLVRLTFQKILVRLRLVK